VVFDREPVDGYLTAKQVLKRDAGTGDPGLDGAREVAVSSDGQYVFGMGTLDKTAAIFRVANPAPALYTLQPPSAQAGSAAFTLVVKGHGFVDGAHVRWNAFNAPTTFVNSTEVRASIDAGWFAAAGKVTIGADNPGPGGGPSFNVLTFTVTAPNAPPVPSIDHLNPASVMAGSASTQVDIYGSNFITGAVAYVNGAAGATSLVAATHLRVTVLAAQLAQPGSVSIKVYNVPGNGNTMSNLVALTVSAPGQNPAPALASISPAWLFSHGAGSSPRAMVVNGTNFVDGAVVLLDGNARPTKFVSPTQLKVTISAFDQYIPGKHAITVSNPAPGGGESTAASFEVKPLHQLLAIVTFR
jgi:hypothetical protein